MVESLANEVQGTRFGDQRLTNRLDKIFEQLSAKPNLSIPAAASAIVNWLDAHGIAQAAPVLKKGDATA